jgi:xanthine dehydrogenase molybdenum-binding subunit
MGIRKSVIRVDAVAKATGAAKYVEDLLPRDALFARVVHSTVANGRVTRIDTAEAEQMPGVVTVLTCFQVPDRPFRTGGHHKSLDPAHADVADRLLLTARVRYYGDDVAAVVADTPLHAQLAAEKVRVEYEAYEPLLTPEAAVGAARALHDECPGNELSRMDFTIDQAGKVTFTRFPFTVGDKVEGMAGETFRMPPVHACHLENTGCFAYMEGREMVICSCTQAPHTMRRNVAEAIDMPLGDVRIIKPYLGGGFGNKQDMVYEPLAAFLSRKLGGRCVAVLLTREETFLNTHTRHAMDMTTVTEVDGTGKIINKALRINANGGSYADHGHAVAAYAVTVCFATYLASGRQIGQSSVAYTNLPTAAAMRGYGIPQLVYTVECQMEDIARAHGWDPIEFRRKNMQPQGFYDPFGQFTVRSNGLGECLTRGRELSDWDRRRREYDDFNRTSPQLKKGIGMALFAYKTGVYPVSMETSACRILMDEDGSAKIQVGATELGQGADTIWAQIASEILTIPEERLTVCSTQDTDVSPYDNGAYGSRQTYVCGGAVKKAAELLRDKLLDRASRLLGRPAEQLRLQDEQIADAVTGQALCSIAHVCTYFNYVNDQHTHTEHITAEATYTALSTCFVYGASFVDLEVDVPLGRVTVRKVWAVHDSGTILNPQLASAQVHGGVAMGLGYALGEQMLFDPATGRPLNPNFLDYKIPTAMDIPEIEPVFVETDEPTGPFGNKGLAEPPILAQAPAVRNAILHATGVATYEIPMTPQRLVHAFIRAGLIRP